MRLPPANAGAEAGALCRPVIRVTIVSHVRFLRESLADILGKDAGIDVLGHYATLDDALRETLEFRANVLLLDALFAGGISAVTRIRAAAPGIRVVVFAVVETEENIIAWAQAGVAGYVPNTAALDELTAQLHDISSGRQACSKEVAAGLLQRVAAVTNPAMSPPAGDALLTRRELQILCLIEAGLGNKEIARRLAISLGTTKSHVHNLLAKLGFQRRGQVAAWVRQNARN